MLSYLLAVIIIILYLLDCWVKGTICHLLLGVYSVDVVLISDNVFLVLTLGDVGKHGRVLWLRVRQLVMDQVPNRFT